MFQGIDNSDVINNGGSKDESCMKSREMEL